MGRTIYRTVPISWVVRTIKPFPLDGDDHDGPAEDDVSARPRFSTAETVPPDGSEELSTVFL